jgi:hypothetical protein
VKPQAAASLRPIVPPQGRDAGGQQQHDRNVIDQPERPILPAAPIARDLATLRKRPNAMASQAAILSWSEIEEDIEVLSTA